MNSSKTLSTDMDLFTAALLQVPVQVWGRTVDDVLVLLEPEGMIGKITPNFIRVNGKSYDRDECIIRVEVPS
ncbi:hypothetical protein [Marinicrinis lubricantis]|uniref:DUF4926 domain-containing protein n=1 Tax=Marinicrinis lubricantis TaxID=2086470 RepID=A0ABW1IL34_9BACL